MKYIDADKLIAEIEKRKKELFEIGGDTFENRWACGSLDSIEAFVISLQQEQPDKSFCEENCKGYRDTGGKCFFGFNCSAKKAQEQSEVEINLGNEVENFCLEYDARKDAWYNMTPQDQKLLSNPTWLNFATNIARHFYELGLNARKEE